jgi:hypothetical protein
MDFENLCNLSVSTIETLVNNTPTRSNDPLGDCNMFDLLSRDTNSKSAAYNVAQQQISGLLNKVCVLSFQLRAEQQKSNLLQKIIDMQQEKVTHLRPTATATETPSPDMSLEDRFLKRELEAKVTFLEEKCSLQEQIMSLQHSWIEDLQWNDEENREESQPED